MTSGNAADSAWVMVLWTSRGTEYLNSLKIQILRVEISAVPCRHLIVLKLHVQFKEMAPQNSSMWYTLNDVDLQPSLDAFLQVKN